MTRIINLRGKAISGQLSAFEQVRFCVFDEGGQTFVHARSKIFDRGRFLPESAHGTSIPFSDFAQLWPVTAAELLIAVQR